MEGTFIDLFNLFVRSNW